MSVPRFLTSSSTSACAAASSAVRASRPTAITLTMRIYSSCGRMRCVQATGFPAVAHQQCCAALRQIVPRSRAIGIDSAGWLRVEHRHGPNGRARSTTPLQRQADEEKLALADQRLQVAQTLDVRDVEAEAGFVHEGVDVALGAWPHRVDAEVHD